jgi:hypothetical protein
MSLSAEINAKIQVTETKLAEIDWILHDFCSRRGFTFRSFVGVWPRRAVRAREEIDRTLDLTMDLTVPEFFALGFQPGMPWSLYATASLPVSQDYPSHVLSVDVFRRLPFSELPGVLATRLEEGLTTLRKINREDILSKGQIYGEDGRAT